MDDMSEFIRPGRVAEGKFWYIGPRDLAIGIALGIAQDVTLTLTARGLFAEIVSYEPPVPLSELLKGSDEPAAIRAALAELAARGYVVIEAGELCGWAPVPLTREPPVAPEAAAPAAPAGQWCVVAEAVALISASLHGIDGPGLSGDVRAEDVARLLARMTATVLREHLPPGSADIALADLGLLAAREGGR